MKHDSWYGWILIETKEKGVNDYILITIFTGGHGDAISSRALTHGDSSSLVSSVVPLLLWLPMQFPYVEFPCLFRALVPTVAIPTSSLQEVFFFFLN